MPLKTKLKTKISHLLKWRRRRRDYERLVDCKEDIMANSAKEEAEEAGEHCLKISTKVNEASEKDAGRFWWSAIQYRFRQRRDAVHGNELEQDFNELKYLMVIQTLGLKTRLTDTIEHD